MLARPLLVLGLLVALPVAAQPDDSGSAAPGITPGQEAALLGPAVLASVGGAALLVRVSDSADLGLTATVLPLLALPAVSAGTVCALASAMALDGRCGAAFRAAFLYALPGYALVGVGLSMRSWDGLGLAVLGGLGLMLAPPFAATDGYRRSVAPAVVYDPTAGATVPGLRVALSF